jgi:hypothetical protein
MTGHAFGLAAAIPRGRLMAFQATVVQKKLEEAGFEPKLAYGLTAVLERDVVDDLQSRLVTREYFDARLAELKAELRVELRTEIGAVRTEMSGLRAELKTEIAGLRSELIKWMAGFIGGSTLAIILTLPRVMK